MTAEGVVQKLEAHSNPLLPQAWILGEDGIISLKTPGNHVPPQLKVLWSNLLPAKKKMNKQINKKNWKKKKTCKIRSNLYISSYCPEIEGGRFVVKKNLSRNFFFLTWSGWIHTWPPWSLKDCWWRWHQLKDQAKMWGGDVQQAPSWSPSTPSASPSWSLSRAGWLSRWGGEWHHPCSSSPRNPCSRGTPRFLDPHSGKEVKKNEWINHEAEQKLMDTSSTITRRKCYLGDFRSSSIFCPILANACLIRAKILDKICPNTLELSSYHNLIQAADFSSGFHP